MLVIGVDAHKRTHTLAVVDKVEPGACQLEGDPAEAVGQIDRALVRFEGLEGETARCLHLKARALVALNRRDEARSLLTRAIELFAKTEARHEQANCYRELGEIELRDGRVEEALRSLQAGLAVLGPKTQAPLSERG